MSDTASKDAPAPPDAVEDPPPVDGVAVTIDGQAIVARKGELIIEAAERNGIYIPRFCYHPRMESVGMCRMCIVEVDTGRGPALLPSCMLECTPDMKVDTTSPVTQKAQDGVLEFLLINHPLDCPVCDKGGECPLQDQTMAYGPGESRFVEEKRHKEKPIPVSDLVLLDRERCILCDRCTRFAKDVAGDPLIHFINRGNETEINTFPDEPFSSYFSGNTVQICPVGALTASSYRFRARPWDLEAVESTCQGCSVGCRISVESSRNQVLRYQGVDVDPVNWGWLCDKGRFGFEAQRSSDRLSEPLVREGDAHTTARWTTALDRVATSLRASSPDRVAVIGGARLTNEAAYAWAKLAKGVIGTDHVDAQLGDGLDAEVALGLPPATIDQICEPGGTVVLVAPDLKEELPVLYLRLRDAVVSHGVKVIEVSPQSGGFSRYATVSLHPRPGEAGVLARALLDGPPPGTDAGGVDANDLVKASELVAAGAIRVVVGRQSVAESDRAVIDAASALLARKPDTTFLVGLRRGNVRGALDMGLAPGLLPGRVSLEAGRSWYQAHWPGLPARKGLDCTGILSAAADGAIDVLILLGADPLSDFPDRDLAARALAGATTVVAIDEFATASVATATVILPAAGFTEVEGTTTNLEGRVSAVHAKVTAPGTARPDWIIAVELAAALGADLGVESIDAIRTEVATLAPSHLGLTPELIESAASADGVVVPLPARPTVPDPDEVTDAPADENAEAHATPTEPGDPGAEPEAVEADAAAVRAQAGPAVPELLTFSPGAPSDPPVPDAYSLRLVASRKLYDQGVAVQHSPSLADLAPGSILRVNPYDFDRLGVAAGDQVRVHSSRAELRAEIVSDTGLSRGAAAVFFNQADLQAGSLIDATARVTDVRVETDGGRPVIIAADPLLVGHLDWGVIAVVVAKVVIVFVLLLLATMLMIWFERKLVSDMQNRVGPNLAGPFGVLQTLADGIKFFFKEDLIPDRAQRGVFMLAPFLSFVPAFLLFAIVPIGGDFNGDNHGIIHIFGHATFMQVADPPIGILFALAMSSIAVYGVMLAGWSSGSKYPLLGSVRASAQMVSYEAAMGLSVLAVILKAGTLTTHGIVQYQAGPGWGNWVPNWSLIVTGVVPFVIFVIAGTAELNRPPFDLVEAEQELVGGFNTEYSSIRFALFYLAEFMNTITMSAIFVTLFLGGPAGPAYFGPGWMWGCLWFFLKLMVFLFGFVWLRASLPRFRYDQLMDLGWKVLIPLALGWTLLLAAIQIGQDENWNPVAVVVVSIAVMLGGYMLLRAAISGSRARRLEQVGA